MHRRFIARRKYMLALAAILGSGTMLSDGCFDSAIAQRFRDASASGVTDGLTAAITDPTNAETGLRSAWAALVDGLGAVVQTRAASSSTSGSSSQTGSGA